MNSHPFMHPHPINPDVEIPLAEPFPTAPLEGESNEAFAERKRRWARIASERLELFCWAAPGYVPD